MSKTAAQLKAEIRRFLAEQKRYGDSYRDASGNYSHDRYQQHNRLVGELYDAKRTAAAARKTARLNAAIARKRLNA